MTSSAGFKIAVATIALGAVVVIVRMAQRGEPPATPPIDAVSPADRVQRRLHELPVRPTPEHGAPDTVPVPPAPAAAVRPPAAVVAPRRQEVPNVTPPAPHAGNATGTSALRPSEAQDTNTLKNIALNDADAERRLEAVTLLGSSEDADVIPILGQALSDSDAEVRLAAIEALEDFTGDTPVELLSNVVVNDPDADNRYEALEALSDVGGDRVTALAQRALTDPDDDVRTLAESVLEVDQAATPPPAPPR
jgi:hypothetical protein